MGNTIVLTFMCHCSVVELKSSTCNSMLTVNNGFIRERWALAFFTFMYVICDSVATQPNSPHTGTHGGRY